MSRVWQVMQGFRRELAEFLPLVRRSACVREVELRVHAGTRGEFDFIARWADDQGEREYVKVFTVGYVMGHEWASANALAVRLACKERVQLVRELLNIRLNRSV